MPHSSNSVQPCLPTTANHPDGDSLVAGRGCVYLVGAGPGDPGLLTIRGRECLERADVVLYDGLASDQLLEFAQQAECVSVGKHGQVPLWSQTDINDRMLQLVRSGKRVVRLKGGDPAVFARTAEELEVLVANDIPFEVVPGITAALAAASYVGIPITHRHFASAVAFVTGQQQADQPQAIDWQALANFPGTLVFYMGVTTVHEWTTELMAAGKPAETPAAIIRRCTWPDQTVVRCELSEVADLLTPASRMRPPVIVIVGSVAGLGTKFDWFASRPLHGCGVLITRAVGQQDDMAQVLRELGSDVYHQPMFSVQPPQDMTSLDAAIDKLSRGEVAGITFSSSNGVDGLWQRIWAVNADARILAGVQLAAVGAATAARLERYGLRCDLLPQPGADQSAQGLLERLKQRGVAGERWLVTTTNRSQPTLLQGLVELDAQAEECLSYVTQPAEELKPLVQTALRSGRIRYVTITSSFIAEVASALLAEYRSKVQPIAISQAVADKLETLGWPAAAVATENSSSAIIKAITGVAEAA